MKRDLFLKELRVLYVEKRQDFALEKLTILAVPVNVFSNDAIKCSNLKILTLTTQFIGLQQIPCSYYALIAIFSSDILLTCTITISFTGSSTSIARCKVENQNPIILNIKIINQKRMVFKINLTGSKDTNVRVSQVD